MALLLLRPLKSHPYFPHSCAICWRHHAARLTGQHHPHHRLTGTTSTTGLSSTTGTARLSSSACTTRTARTTGLSNSTCTTGTTRSARFSNTTRTAGTAGLTNSSRPRLSDAPYSAGTTWPASTLGFSAKFVGSSSITIGRVTAMFRVMPPLTFGRP